MVRAMDENGIKLQKYIAQSGICSRRSAEQAILKGEVTVNGVAAMLGSRVTGNENILYRGIPVTTEDKVYYILNKPVGVICTMKEQFGRRALPELTAKIKERVYPVGRLDMDSEGLLILTNDGALTLRLTHPRYHTQKTYIVTVRGEQGEHITGEQAMKLLASVRELDGEPLKPVELQLRSDDQRCIVMEVKLTEGKNRQIRRMCAAAGLEVLALRRTAVGRLTLGGLAPGEYRRLDKSELPLLEWQSEEMERVK